ncbi:MAG TPA: DUF1294 domain-containing protein [Methanomassiliicoccales archaeon]|nr:DUF1294 domain-containing protein [Methanomassiliicoccales archaeon]
MNSLYFVIIIAVIFILNMYSYLLYRSDKMRAIKGEWRISEGKLLVASFFGPFGAYGGMKRFHHKTQKMKFKLVAIFLIFQIIMIILASVYFAWPEIIDPYIPLSFLPFHITTLPGW